MQKSIEITNIILIRHAERDNTSAIDPHLNAKGIVRANNLVQVLGSAEIKSIYTSHYIRTRETAAPLAAHLGILPIQLDDSIDIRNHILGNHVGENVVVVGHTDTIPELIGLFSGEGKITVAENEFDNLFMLTHSSAGTLSIVVLKYGNLG